MSYLGWSLPPGVTDADIDREAERLEPDDRCHRCDCRYMRRLGAEFLCEACYEAAMEDE